MDNLKKIDAFLNTPSDDEMVYGESLTEQVEDDGLPMEIRIPASEFPEYDEYYDDEDGELYTELNIYIEDNYGASPVDFHWVITPEEIIISDINWSDGEDIEPEVEEQEVEFPEDDFVEDLTEAKLKKDFLTDENLANFKMEIQEIKDNLDDFGPEGFYAVPYESFKREFPIFTEKVIESFLKEMEDDGEGDWQEGTLIWDNDWPCLLEGAEKLLNGKGFQWEKIYTKHYKPANESLNESSSRKDNIDIIEKELEADFYGLTLEDYYEDEDTLMISIRDAIGEIYDISIKKSELDQPGGLSYILFNELDLAIERGDVTEDRPVDESLNENYFSDLNVKQKKAYIQEIIDDAVAKLPAQYKGKVKYQISDKYFEKNDNGCLIYMMTTGISEQAPWELQKHASDFPDICFYEEPANVLVKEFQNRHWKNNGVNYEKEPTGNKVTLKTKNEAKAFREMQVEAGCFFFNGGWDTDAINQHNNEKADAWGKRDTSYDKNKADRQREINDANRGADTDNNRRSAAKDPGNIMARQDAARQAEINAASRNESLTEEKWGRPKKVGPYEVSVPVDSVKRIDNIINSMEEDDFDLLLDTAYDAYDGDKEAKSVVRQLFRKYKLPMWALAAFVENFSDQDLFRESLTESAEINGEATPEQIEKFIEEAAQAPDKINSESAITFKANNREVTLIAKYGGGMVVIKCEEPHIRKWLSDYNVNMLAEKVNTLLAGQTPGFKGDWGTSPWGGDQGRWNGVK